MKLRKALFILPNLMSATSAFFGTYAIIECGRTDDPNRFYSAALAIFFAMILDVLDGRVARLTKTESELGLQIDSLADLVSFGVAPAVLVYRWAFESLGVIGVAAAAVYVAAGAMRLARFNVSAAKGGASAFHFVGLPTPAAAGLLASIAVLHHVTYGGTVKATWNVLVAVIVLGYLMVSNIRYWSFKHAPFSRRTLAVVTACLAAVYYVATVVSPAFTLVALFGCYVASGLLGEIVFFRRRRAAEAFASELATADEAAVGESFDDGDEDYEEEKLA
jgi:CDP-diacylglycerol--serine O-phosphatidyltransferase